MELRTGRLSGVTDHSLNPWTNRSVRWRMYQLMTFSITTNTPSQTLLKAGMTRLSIRCSRRRTSENSAEGIQLLLGEVQPYSMTHMKKIQRYASNACHTEVLFTRTLSRENLDSFLVDLFCLERSPSNSSLSVLLSYAHSSSFDIS